MTIEQLVEKARVAGVPLKAELRNSDGLFLDGVKFLFGHPDIWEAYLSDEDEL